jgi:hypothetical protein
MVLFDIWNNAIWIFLTVAIVVIVFFAWAKYVSSPKVQSKIARDTIKKYFGFLFEKGFEIEPTPFIPGPNGAWSMVLISENCKIRVIQDRGDVFCEVKPAWQKSEKYQDIPEIITTVRQNLETHYPSKKLRNSSQRFEYYGKLLEKHFDEIIKYIDQLPKPT